MKILKNYLFKGLPILGFLTVAFVLLPQSVQAGFGISPAEISRDFLKPGAKFEQELVLSRSDYNEDLIVTIEPDLEEMSDWFQFSTGTSEITFPQGIQRLNVTVSVNVPPEAEYKTYEGRIRFKASPASQEEGGVSIVQGARVEVALVTTELDVTDLEIRQIKAADAFSGENIRIGLLINNKGNVAAAPSRVTLDIQNLQQEDLESLEDTNIDLVEPNETKEVFAEFSSNLPTGEYFGNVSVYLSDELLRQERLVFTINEAVRTKDADMGQTQSTSLMAGLTDFFATNMRALTYLAVFSGIVSLLALVILLIRGALSRKAKGAVAILSVLVIGSLALLFASAMYLTPKEPEPEPEAVSEEQVAPTPLAVEEPEPVEEEASKEAEVKGAFTSSPEVSGEPTLVSNPDQVDGYRIYQNPDRNSEVIMLAEQGDTFNVIEENQSWYKVSISGQDNQNNSGWIHKNDIIDVQQQ